MKALRCMRTPLFGLLLSLLVTVPNLDAATRQSHLDSELNQLPQRESGDLEFVADLDGDGDLDIVRSFATRNQERGTLSWYELQGTDRVTWRAHQIDASGHSGIAGLAVDDLDQDGDTDVVASYALTDEIVWWENRGAEGWQRHGIDRGSYRANHLETRDVDLDGRIDIVIRTEGQQEAIWWHNMGEGSARWIERSDNGETMLAWAVPVRQMRGEGDTTESTDKACVSAPSNIRAWYPFDESSGTTANDQVGSNDGTHVNGPLKVTGRVSRALDFDGSNDYVTVADNSQVEFGTGDFTIETWIKTSDSYGMIAGKRQYSGGTYTGYLFMVYGGRLLLQIGDSTNSWRNYHDYSGPTVNNNAWRHVAVTVDRSSSTGGRFYIDGSLVYTFNPTSRTGNTNNSAPLEIGRTTGGGDYFDGTIDEVTLYNRALTSSQISSIRNAGSSGKCKTSSPPPLSAFVSCFPTSPDGSSQYCSAGATGGIAPYSYGWSFSGGFISGGGPTASAYFTYCSPYGTIGTVYVNVSDSIGNTALAATTLFCGF